MHAGRRTVSEWTFEGPEGLAGFRRRVRVDVRRPDQFLARGVTAALATATVTRMTLSPQRQAGIEHHRPGQVSACVLVTGAATVTTGARVTRLGRGQGYFASGRPWDAIDVTEQAGLVTIEAPRTTLAEHNLSTGARRFLGGWRLPEPSLWMLESLCEWLSVPSMEFSCDSIRAAESALLKLFGTTTHDASRQVAVATDASSSIHHDALRIIAAEFRDTDLNAPAVAKRLGVSLRTLHRAFESRSASISMEIRNRRIEYAESLLQGTRHGHLTLAEIARLCGAPSLAYLRMGIRDKHNVSPTQLRTMWSSAESAVGDTALR